MESGKQPKESRIPLTIETQNPSFTDKDWNPPESKTVLDSLRDGSLFMGMTGSGKNRTGFENFSCHGDGLSVFFLNKETGL